MIRIGVECENLEDPKSRWGVSQLALNLLKEYEADTELQKKYKLYLYFKKKIPNDEFLKNPVFIKRVLGFPSFNIFYHILMPLRAMADGLDWMFFPAYMLPPLYLGKSIVLLTPDVYYEYKQGTLPFRYKLAYRLFTNWAAKFATKILAISETSKKEVARLYNINPDRIFVSYPGINTPKTTNYELGTRNYILYIGQAFPRRHLRETILAFKEIAKEFPDLKLIAVGKDKYPPSPRFHGASNLSLIEELIKITNQELGDERIIHYDYLDKREDIESLYANAKALVYVSDREAFGLPPMEALSFGVSPVIMDNELGHELFGEYAIYAKSGSVEDIAETIKRVLRESDPSTTLRTSRLAFAKKYNWRSFAEIFFKDLS